MSSEFTQSKLKEYALAYLLIDLASVDSDNQGEPVSDEELAIFIEPRATSKLGELRCKQILAQLSTNAALYEQWLILSDSAIIDGPFEGRPLGYDSPQAIADRSTFITWLQSLVEPLLTPKLNWVTAISLAAVTLMASLWLRTETPVDEELAVNTPNQLPPKASQGSLSSDHLDIANPEVLLQQNIVCTPSSPPASICYTTTDQMQHWFLIENQAVHSLPAPPITAARIINVDIQTDKLLIEYATNETFAVAIFAMKAENHLWKLTPLHQDEIKEGVFENIQLNSVSIKYQKHYYDGKTETFSTPLK